MTGLSLRGIQPMGSWPRVAQGMGAEGSQGSRTQPQEEGAGKRATAPLQLGLGLWLLQVPSATGSGQEVSGLGLLTGGASIPALGCCSPSERPTSRDSPTGTPARAPPRSGQDWRAGCGVGRLPRGQLEAARLRGAAEHPHRQLRLRGAARAEGCSPLPLQLAGASVPRAAAQVPWTLPRNG